MRRRRKMNVVSVWITVIFTVIAVTLVSMFLLVYHSILQSEQRATLREQVGVLRDNADARVVDVIQNQAARSLATRDTAANCINAMVEGYVPAVAEIQELTDAFAQVKASIDSCERVELYFPSTDIVIGSQGVQYLADPKYTVPNFTLDYMRALYPSNDVWIKRVLPSGSGTQTMITYLRLYPGIYPAGMEPMLAVSIEESDFMKLVRASMRTLGSGDFLMLIEPAGTIWSYESMAAAGDNGVSLAGTAFPEVEAATDMVVLANGVSGMVAEAASASGAWYYALLHPSAVRAGGYGALVSVWAILCVVMLFVGLVMVLRVLMKHYSEPMQRLMANLLPNEAGSARERKLDSPSENFLQLETALSDMNKLRQEQQRFMEHNQPILRQSWLNCFLHGEAYYAAPYPELGLEFPHPHFQVVVLSATPTEDELEMIARPFQNGDWVLERFESREKETVLLFNHGFDEAALPTKLRVIAEELDDASALVFGVGVLSQGDELVPASFRCARRALSSRYFEKDQRVCVFDPAARHAEAESALSQIIGQLTELTNLIRRESQEDVEHAVDSIVTQLKETTPYLNTMRSIMLLAAMSLSKVVYDMKGAPETVYGENLLNAYYHISDISEFSARLKQDCIRLRHFLSQESSPANRSVVQYAIHHIQGCEPAELSIQGIAEAIGISTGHLSRMFHQETGRKLVDYLQEVRMEHAARLLAEGVLSNEEICDRIGYSRLQYFATKFKEHYGFTLNEYRRRSQ